MTIGALAKVTGVHIETIRFYQRRGLMAEPERPAGGVRRYGDADAERMRFIKSSQALGFSLDEVSILLTLEDGTDCETADTLAQKKLFAVKNKISTLQQIEKSLTMLIGQCRQNKGQRVSCPLISSLHSNRHYVKP